MKKLYVVLIVLVLLVVGVGFYRGWFALSSPGADKGSNKVNVNLTMDGDKMQQDAAAVKNKATELTGTATAGTGERGDQAKDSK
jgi:cell division protein FtsX